MKVLVVDDSRFARASLIHMIEELDNNIEIFQGVNGQEGVDLYKEQSPDIIFLDLTMPVKSGFEALDEIIAYDNNANVIIISADIQTKAKEKVKEAGAKLMVQKPIKAVTLRSIVEDFTNGK